MSPPSLAVFVLLAGLSAADRTRVYRYVDSKGVEHYVDHPESIPAGVKAEPIDLNDVPLNPEVAKALSDAAKHAVKPAAPKLIAPAGETPTDKAPPAEAQLFLWWSMGLTLAFAGLWILTSVLRDRAPALAFAFGVVRFAAGSLALMSWVGTAYEYRESRRWLAEHIPPLRALDQAFKTKTQVDRQTKQMEHDVDKALRGE